MKKQTLIPSKHPFEQYLVGSSNFFDDLEDFMCCVEKQDKFPPHNIEKDKETGDIYLKIALAGYNAEDLDAEIDSNILRIKTVDDYTNTSIDDEKIVYRGIALRSFDVRFKLADYLEFKEHKFDNGILEFWFENTHPEPKKISII